MSTPVHELKQLACIQQHKRHLIYRTGKKESPNCVWCGLPWDTLIHEGEMVRWYGKGGYSIDAHGKSGIRNGVNTPLKDLVIF